MPEINQVIETPLKNERIASIDVFRGLTILAMIFVNDLARLRGIPAWMCHAPTDADAMTFVDVVFPAFLFIVGLAIPLALGRRLARGEPIRRILGHIVMRTAALLIIGVLMLNMREIDPDATGISRDAWTALMFAGVVLVWNDYTKAEPGRRRLDWALRGLGCVVLIVMAAIFRGSGQGDDGVTWLRTGWWGILGLIGWAYLTTCVAYLALRRSPAAMVGMVALMTALSLGDRAGALSGLAFISEYVWLGGHIGGHASITMAGVLIGMLFVDDFAARRPGARIAWMLLLAVGLAAAGWLLRPLHGISKNDATPTWCLYSAAICCACYAGLYWLVDLKGARRAFAFVGPAGSNALLAYILPGILYAVLGIASIDFLQTHFNEGTVGILRAAVFALAIVALTGALGRLGIRLRL